MRNTALVHFSLLLFASPLAASANVTLPPLFGDHAVLQKGPATGIWGQGAPGEKVELMLGSARASAVTDTNGWWRAKLDLSKLGEGPFELRAKGPKNEVVSKDVLVGEVWLASGQSNMELPFVTSLFGTVFGFDDLCQQSAGRPIRVFRKNLTWAMERDMRHQGGRWILPTREDLAKCSAVGFSFIEAVQREIGGPVALVDLSIGGTRTMQWTSHEKLANTETWHGYWTNQVEQLARQQFAERWKAQNGLRPCGFDYQKLQAATWKRGSLPTDVARGVSYYRIKLPVPPKFMEDGVTAMTQFWFKGLRTTRCSVTWFRKDRGWISGEALQQENFEVVGSDRTDSVMRTIADGKMEVLLRIEAILPGAKIAYDNPRISKWDKFAQVDLPRDGWDVYEEIVYPPLPAGAELPKPYKVPQARMENFYNSMVYPFRDLTFRGAIWYQGCSDACFADNVHEYPVWFKAMVDDWRETFGNGDFPFYWCQLAGYGGFPNAPGAKNGQAEIREAQRRSRGVIANGEMAVIYDTGEGECHGRDKIPAGQRLARIALARDYGRKNLVYRSADYVKKAVKGSDVLLTFETYGSPLVARPVKKTYTISMSYPEKPVVRRSPASPLEGFVLRDAKGAWHWANAEIVDAKTVRVWADGVADPVEVRYNWGGLGAGNLWNEGGLPVSPFTTEK